MKLFLDRMIDDLGIALDVRMKRHALIASNIANADTPGFKPREMEFEKFLQAQFSGENDGGSDELPDSHEDPAPTMRVDGNRVDMDREMVRMSQNSFGYNAATRVLGKKLGMLRYAVMDGRSG